MPPPAIESDVGKEREIESFKMVRLAASVLYFLPIKIVNGTADKICFASICVSMFNMVVVAFMDISGVLLNAVGYVSETLMTEIVITAGNYCTKMSC